MMKMRSLSLKKNHRGDSVIASWKPKFEATQQSDGGLRQTSMSRHHLPRIQEVV